MRCEDMAERLTDLMEGQLDPDEEAAALEHLAGCTHCETVLAETRDAVQLAQDHGRVELADEDRARMLDSIVGQLAAPGDAPSADG